MLAKDFSARSFYTLPRSVEQ